jgi:hypothetical protein
VKKRIAVIVLFAIAVCYGVTDTHTSSPLKTRAEAQAWSESYWRIANVSVFN